MTVLVELFPSCMPPPPVSRGGTALLVSSKTRPTSGSMSENPLVHLPVVFSSRLRDYLNPDSNMKFVA